MARSGANGLKACVTRRRLREPCISHKPRLAALQLYSPETEISSADQSRFSRIKTIDFLSRQANVYVPVTGAGDHCRTNSSPGLRKLMQILDVDTHAIETESVWNYLGQADEEFRPSILVKESGARIDTHFAGPKTREFWVIDNEIYGKHDVAMIAEASSGELSVDAITMDNIDQRLAAMDTQGVDVQVVFSSLFLNLRIERREAELALTRAYNRWLAERCAQGDGRLRWIMVPSLKNPSATIADMAWARDNGAVGVLFRGIEGDRYLDHQDFDPIYAQAQELDMPICVHIGHGCEQLETIRHRSDSEFNRFNSDSPNYFAFSSLLRSNLHEIFPRLRFGFFESGSSWIPTNVQTTLHVRLPPPELMALSREKIEESNFYITCELHEDLATITRYTGTDNLVLGSDYGHPYDIADTMINYRRVLDERTDLDEDFRSKVISENCQRLFAL
jgi:predicted TIM-barrel fold metal-dependent hydrolase